MDIVCAEAELMFSMYPTQILANLNPCRVRQAGNVPSLAAETERAGNTDADNPVRQIRRIPDSLYTQLLGRDLPGRLSSEVCLPDTRYVDGNSVAVSWL